MTYNYNCDTNKKEIKLLWCLDVTFHEDRSRMRKDHSAENFAVVRHIVLNMLKSLDDKLSVARRRRRAYDDAYLEKVLLSIHACAVCRKKTGLFLDSVLKY